MAVSFSVFGRETRYSIFVDIKYKSNQMNNYYLTASATIETVDTFNHACQANLHFAKIQRILISKHVIIVLIGTIITEFINTKAINTSPNPH